MPTLMGYISEWKAGNRGMAALMGNIADWKTGANCGATRTFNGWTLPYTVDGWLDTDTLIARNVAAGGRVVYVSNSQGNNSYDGLSEASPKKTISAGIALIRHLKPDVLLLKREDVWYEALGFWLASGQSPEYPLLISSYGSGVRPLLKTGANDGIRMQGGGGSPATRDNIIIAGIDFYAHTRDPSSPEFIGSPAGNGGISYLRPGQNLLIEDSVFRYYRNNVTIQGEGSGFNNFVLRRSILTDSYSTDSHSQGLYMWNVHGAIIEENLIDHSGWNEQVPGAEATIFNHNLYIQYTTNENIVIRKNIIARASSNGLQLRSGGVNEDNLYVANAIAAFNSDQSITNGDMGVMRGNIVLEGKDIAPSLPRKWGLEVNDEDNTITIGIVENNIIANTPNGVLPLALDTSNPVIVRRNIIFNWGESRITGRGLAVAILSGNEEGLPASSYVDPYRTVETYNASLGGSVTLEAFLQEARKQSRTNWRPEYTAEAVNNYIRAGFARVG